MKARFLSCLAGAFRRLAREESGVALMMTLAVFLLLYILCCGVYATGEIIRQKQELQNACDAAAYSAALVQADAFSRMAVVNRAMAWTYIQLCREQMDYIVFCWLQLTGKRFWWDFEHKADEGGIGDFRHYYFKDVGWGKGAVGCGLYDYYHRHDDAFYTGVGDTLGQRKLQHVSLNWRNGFSESVAMKDIDEVVEGLDKMSMDVYGDHWKAVMRRRILADKALIFSMNATLAGINQQMGKAIEATIPYVLYLNLPRNSEGQLTEDEIGDFYWSAIGGASPAPEAYSGLLPPQGDGEDNLAGSYYSALGNTEEDEIKFLTMADGIPGRAAGAPGWMGKRPAVLSDYFGFGDNPTESGESLTRYVAGGLDQWYVRGSREEALDKRSSVPKQLLEPPGGIMRVYKHSNREEGEVFDHFLRPNHVFQMEWGAVPSISQGQFDDFKNPAGYLQEIFKLAGPQIAKKIHDKLRDNNRWMSNRTAWRIANPIGRIVSGLGSLMPANLFGGMAGLGTELTKALDGLFGGGHTFSELLSFVKNGDIPPSNEHSAARYPDQCRNVNECTALVSQYEWASAYWLCPWVKVPYIGLVELGHYRLPISEILGCEMHGYENWLATQIDILTKGKVTRDEFRSCFINFDPTSDMDKNTFLRGYARIYGDDEEIFDEECYIGERACPWVLSPAFFDGDGTILVGFARKQTNPFARLLAKGVSVARPSLYEPFSPQPGADRYLVAFSAARAAWAHRPDNAVTGLESVNDPKKPIPPGKYDIRFDWVTEHKKVSGRDHELTYDFGCVCGEKKTQGRLLRMWNLSQTDWDATLLPLRHAFCGYLGDLPHYDSYENPDIPTVWDYRDETINAVDGTVERVMNLTWQNGADLVESQLPGSWNGPRENPASLSSGDILSISRERLKEMFVHRRLL